MDIEDIINFLQKNRGLMFSRGASRVSGSVGIRFYYKDHYSFDFNIVYNYQTERFVLFEADDKGYPHNYVSSNDFGRVLLDSFFVLTMRRERGPFRANNGSYSDVFVGGIVDNRICVIPEENEFRYGAVIDGEFFSIGSNVDYDETLESAQFYAGILSTVLKEFDLFKREGFYTDSDKKKLVKILFTSNGYEAHPDDVELPSVQQSRAAFVKIREDVALGRQTQNPAYRQNDVPLTTPAPENSKKKHYKYLWLPLTILIVSAVGILILLIWGS